MFFYFYQKATRLQVDCCINGGFISSFVFWPFGVEKSEPDAKHCWFQWCGGFVQSPAAPAL